MAPVAPRRRSTRRPPQERREAFLDAAVAAIRRDGPKVSMEAIAREAGVTKPIVYRLFGDRDGLLQALGERMAAQINANVVAALDRAPGDDPREMLRTAIASYVELIDTETDVYRFVTEQIGTSTGPAITGLAAEIARTVAVVLGEQLRRAGADSGAAEPWAFGIVGMVHLSGDWWVRHRTLPREQLVTYLVDLLWDGFGSLTPPPDGARPPQKPRPPDGA
jgi:AcrR family transcriptional regulator